MGKFNKAKFLDVLKGLNEEDKKEFQAMYLEAFGKLPSGDADLLETIRAIQKDVEELKGKAGAPPPAPSPPPEPQPSLLDRFMGCFS